MLDWHPKPQSVQLPYFTSPLTRRRLGHLTTTTWRKMGNAGPGGRGHDFFTQGRKRIGYTDT
ncbi:hypothetical protein SAMD00023353_1701470 [Rosellinia necatrix]|uniref:Uncharacterized protein n=1 Tax=Rosellinia necatrix TaxID=77044 RepID=A0A1S8A7S2_ROSNE|nr:hypothetical protein SAMD00023353_1701470 [Rosellinia necatrix]